MTVTAGVAAIKGTYQGSCTLSDLASNESLVMHLSGAGAPGTIDATVKVFFGEAEPGVTKIDYEADAVVGGMVGGVGQRMLTSVSKRMAGEFFGNVASAIGQGPAPLVEQGGAPAPTGVETPAGQAPAPTVFSAPPKKAGVSSQDDFLKGIAVGAGLVVLGVVVGRLFGAAMSISVESTARDQADAVRRREISARELLDLHLERIAERNPELNAIVSLDEERAREGAAAADEALATRRRGRGAARAAVRVQGHPRRRGLAHDVRLAALRRPRRRARRPDRRAGTPRGRGRHRQDQRAGVRGRLPHLQPGLRPDPQPRRPVAVGRRLLRRRRVRAGVRDGAAGGRLRHGWLAAQPGVVLRRGRAAAVARPGAGVAALQPVGDDLGRRPDGPQRRRPRAPAVGDGRAGPAGAAGADGSRHDLRAAARTARSPGCASRSRPTSAARSRSTPRSPRSSRRPHRSSPTPGPRSPTPTRRSPRPTTPSAPCARGTSRPSSG